MTDNIKTPSAGDERETVPFANEKPMPDFIDYVREYARQKPEVAALWCFGVGFVLGWKLKPW